MLSVGRVVRPIQRLGVPHVNEAMTTLRLEYDRYAGRSVAMPLAGALVWTLIAPSSPGSLGPRGTCASARQRVRASGRPL